MKKIINIGVLTIINIGTLFIYQWYILMYFGPGLKTDALFAGMTLPQIVLAVISGALSNVLVPLLSDEDETQSRENAWGFFALILSLFSLLGILLSLTSHLWVPLIIKGFNEEGKTLTIELTRIQLIGMIFSAANGVQLAVNYAKKKFIYVEILQIITNILFFGIMVLILPEYGIIAAAWIYVLRTFFLSLLLMPSMGKPQLPNLKSPAIHLAWKRIKPIIIGSAYYKTDPLIDRYLLSFSGNGNLSIYYMAQQIIAAINQVISKAISMPYLPLISKASKDNNENQFRDLCFTNAVQVSTIGAVILLIISIYGTEIINLLIGYGSIKHENINQMYWMLIYLSGLFIGGALGQVFANAFYAMGETSIVVKISSITYTIYIPGKILGFYLFGVKGLAIATSLLYIVDCLIMMYVLHQKKFL
jgi:putative peptidoglycan lipid II flippase